ncbi:hypothetical protein RRF57_013383 [Xylaria bambusicola]|uniref:Uncharacterized protein n=1 Tax=Xylaria bambusicola TaxID=326684 RepID=A0AAN7V0Q8_9PEZI
MKVFRPQTAPPQTISSCKFGSRSHGNATGAWHTNGGIVWMVWAIFSTSSGPRPPGRRNPPVAELACTGDT